MKLVDILARELKVWPEGVRVITQQQSGYLFDEDNYPIGILVSESEDCFSATVPRAQWKAAVDALKAEAAPAWVGVGLPPIGIDVEVFAEYSHPRFDRFLGQRVHIVAHDVINGDRVAVFRMPVDGDYAEQDYHAMVAGSFRPIRTPEQIAADKRLHEIRNAPSSIHAGQNLPNDLVRGNIVAATVEAMIDAGYRKFEILDN